MDREFRERMYDVLGLYQEPYDPKKPVLGVDEKPVQIIADSRKSIRMAAGKPEKCDYEYIRKGTANVFVAVEPKEGKRIFQAADRRTKRDFALFVKRVIDKGYPEAELIRLIIDNLNTHSDSSLHETFDEKEANRLLNKIEFHYTPKHASWLNVAEIEIAAMGVECTSRRFNDRQTLNRELRAWAKKRNKDKKKINWSFTKTDADRKLSKHYTT